MTRFTSKSHYHVLQRPYIDLVTAPTPPLSLCPLRQHFSVQHLSVQMSPPEQLQEPAIPSPFTLLLYCFGSLCNTYYLKSYYFNICPCLPSFQPELGWRLHKGSDLSLLTLVSPPEPRRAWHLVNMSANEWDRVILLLPWCPENWSTAHHGISTVDPYNAK